MLVLDAFFKKNEDMDSEIYVQMGTLIVDNIVER